MEFWWDMRAGKWDYMGSYGGICVFNVIMGCHVVILQNCAVMYSFSAGLLGYWVEFCWIMRRCVHFRGDCGDFCVVIIK